MDPKTPSHNIRARLAHFFPWFDEDADLQQPAAWSSEQRWGPRLATTGEQLNGKRKENPAIHAGRTGDADRFFLEKGVVAVCFQDSRTSVGTA